MAPNDKRKSAGSRAVVSHISQKTSEMWGTRLLVAGTKLSGVIPLLTRHRKSAARDVSAHTVERKVSAHRIARCCGKREKGPGGNGPKRSFPYYRQRLWPRPYQSNDNKSRSLGRIAKPLIARDKPSLSRPLLTPCESRRQL
jgi:hypothetical protein